MVMVICWMLSSSSRAYNLLYCISDSADDMDARFKIQTFIYIILWRVAEWSESCDLTTQANTAF